MPALPYSDEPSPDELAKLLNLSDRQPDPLPDNIDMTHGEGGIFSDLNNLSDQISDLRRPTANAVVRYSTQSDHLDIRQEDASQDLFFNHGVDRFGLGVQAINYNPAVGPSINQYAGGLTGHSKLNNFLEITGEAWINSINWSNLGYYRATYDAYLTIRPSDSLRIDLDSNRRLFDNITSLQMRITAQSWGGSVDFTPNGGIRLTARAAGSSFSDGNWRRTEELEGVWRVDSSPLIEIGFRGTNFHFDKLLNNGYFNPRNYTSGEGVLHVSAPLTKLLSADFTGSVGVEDANPGGDKPLEKAALRLSYKLSRHWSLDTEASYFSSRSSNSSGFARTSVFLGLHYRF